jgi:isoleucyl-tRNA synthetase
MTVNVIKAFDSFVEDVSTWYIRRSRRRFWEEEDVALRTLWWAVVQGLQVIAPIIPFLTEHLWANLVVRACPWRARLRVPGEMAGARRPGYPVAGGD